ncbi:MAG TPA: hypothetical protein VFR71_06390 [Methyloceanibacter sp.]|nr:hypothetical protein [Methyloceanibacter sp.]
MATCIFAGDQLLDARRFEPEERILARIPEQRHLGQGADTGEMRTALLGERRGKLNFRLGIPQRHMDQDRPITQAGSFSRFTSS